MQGCALVSGGKAASRFGGGVSAVVRPNLGAPPWCAIYREKGSGERGRLGPSPTHKWRALELGQFCLVGPGVGSPVGLIGSVGIWKVGLVSLWDALSGQKEASN